MSEILGCAKALVFVAFGVVFALSWIEARRQRAEELENAALEREIAKLRAAIADLPADFPLLTVVLCGALLLAPLLLGRRSSK